MIRKLTLLPFLFALPSLGLLFAQPSEGRQFAFLVACGDYDKTQLNPVSFTVPEMTAFRQVLIDSGVPDKNIVFLHDKTGEPRRFLPLRENILKELSLLMQRLRPEDSVIVALSGHGVQFDGEKYGYFCPLNANLAKKDTLLPMGGDNGLLERIDQGKAGKKLLIVNACRNKPTSSVNLAAEKLQLRDDYNEEAPKGTVMMLACKQGQFSWFYDDKEKRAERRNRSLFMYHLTEAWKGSYAKGKKVTVDHLVAEVSDRVEADANADFNRNQIPIIKRRLEGQWDLASAAIAKQITNSIGMKLTFIAPGKFMMGSPKEELYHDESELQHEVELTRSFYLGVYLVTQEQYETVMGKNPSWFSAQGEGKASVAGINTRRFPVERVSWHDATEFCQKLGAKEGKTYRLPTEAEWEYACRAGTTTPFHFGETISTDQANYKGSQIYGNGKKGLNRERPTPVGSFAANAWGLHDMHGNVWQWCEDWYDAVYYNNSPNTNPLNDAKGQSRVARGGSWNDDPWAARLGCRANRVEPDAHNSNFGFRVVLSSSIRKEDVAPSKEAKEIPNTTNKNADRREVIWSHAFDLTCRKFGEADFTKDTKRWGVEACRDDNTKLGLYISQSGSIALAPNFADLKMPVTSSQAPKWFTGLDLRVRKAGEKEFKETTKSHSMESFRDPNADNWLLINEQGNIAATTGKLFPGATEKVPKWVHSVDLTVRKGGVTDWQDATKFGIEVYSDGNTGNLIYITETGNMAIIPEKKNVAAGNGKSPEWLHGLDLSCRKPDEISFTAGTRKFGAEVYHDTTTGNLIFISETGGIAVVPAPDQIKASTPMPKAEWTHGLNVRCRKYGENKFSSDTPVFGVEVYRDVSLGIIIYVAETGAISAMSQ